MIYLWLKALHIVAVIGWIGGMLLAAFMIVASSNMTTGSDAPIRSAFLDKARRWDRSVTSPAMLLVWVLGLAMTYVGGWLAAPWLMLKLIFVLILSGFHGLLSGTLKRRVRSDTVAAPMNFGYAPLAIILGVFVVVSIVVIKPL